MVELKEQAEEVLETLWILTEEKGETSVSSDDLTVADKESVAQLLKAGYISLTDGRIRLTQRGRPHARNVVRRHRLAERLLVDVLDTGDRLMHEKACKFEHLLDRGLDESICTLLGHPRVCPHGSPIPPGRCCRQQQTPPPKLVSPLSQLTPGRKGKVAYIYATESDKLQKLVAMGVLPGAPIKLMQRYPSYIFQVRQTQFAVDKEIADAIYIRLVEEEAAETTEVPPYGQRWVGGGLGRRFGRWWSRGRPRR